MKLFLSVYKTCFSLGSSFLLFLEKPDNSRCYKASEDRKEEVKKFERKTCLSDTADVLMSP